MLGPLGQGVLVVCVVAPSTLWVAMAIHCRVRRPALRWLASLAPPIVVGLSFRLLPFFPWAVAIWAALIGATFVWWLSLRPRSDRDWAVGMEILPVVELAGDTLRIRQFRNFGYTESGDPLPRYEDRSFDLTRLATVDYYLSHWAGPVMAHTLVSFGFDDGSYLALSVEARRRRWQPYSPIWGLFRAYELMFVLGDERDIVRLRTNIRRERVYLYRVRMPRPNVRALLDDYLARVATLSSRPEWYNSFLSNCTTNLFYRGHNRIPRWVRPKIWLNGFSASALYQYGFLDQSVPFRQLQSESDVRERALAAGNVADFSQQIRTHLRPA
jgi:hypothetical protein